MTNSTPAPQQEPLDLDDVLDRLASLPVSVWSYVFEDHSVRHIGPMAQDFMAAFGVGDDEGVIYNVDAQGVAIAAIKALHRRVVELEAQVANMQADPASPGGKVEVGGDNPAAIRLDPDG